MADDDETPTAGRSGRTDDLADLLGRLGVEAWAPEDVQLAPILPSDVFEDPTPDTVWAGRR